MSKSAPVSLSRPHGGGTPGQDASQWCSMDERVTLELRNETQDLSLSIDSIDSDCCTVLDSPSGVSSGDSGIVRFGPRNRNRDLCMLNQSTETTIKFTVCPSDVRARDVTGEALHIQEPACGRSVPTVTTSESDGCAKAFGELQLMMGAGAGRAMRIKVRGRTESEADFQVNGSGKLLVECGGVQCSISASLPDSVRPNITICLAQDLSARSVTSSATTSLGSSCDDDLSYCSSEASDEETDDSEEGETGIRQVVWARQALQSSFVGDDWGADEDWQDEDQRNLSAPVGSDEVLKFRWQRSQELDHSPVALSTIDEGEEERTSAVCTEHEGSDNGSVDEIEIYDMQQQCRQLIPRRSHRFSLGSADQENTVQAEGGWASPLETRLLRLCAGADLHDAQRGGSSCSRGRREDTDEGCGFESPRNSHPLKGGQVQATETQRDQKAHDRAESCARLLPWEVQKEHQAQQESLEPLEQVEEIEQEGLHTAPADQEELELEAKEPAQDDHGDLEMELNAAPCEIELEHRARGAGGLRMRRSLVINALSPGAWLSLSWPTGFGLAQLMRSGWSWDVVDIGIRGLGSSV